MEHINKILACFYGQYRSFLQAKNKMSEKELDKHLDKFSNRYSIITENCSNPLETKIKFSVRRKKGLRKYVFSQIFNVADFL
jgi:predicted ATP-dependent endonuclease of OLD family